MLRWACKSGSCAKIGHSCNYVALISSIFHADVGYIRRSINLIVATPVHVHISQVLRELTFETVSGEAARDWKSFHAAGRNEAVADSASSN